MNIAIFGGTFDPVHRGHLALARVALEHYKLHRVHFVPANVPPHKQRQPHSLFLLPGQSGTMTLTFTVPNGPTGTTVSGQVPVETFNANSYTSGIGDWSSDVLKVLQYSYTLG